MKKDDKIRVKDSGKRKMSLKRTTNETDSTYSRSMVREVVKPKMVKKKDEVYTFLNNEKNFTATGTYKKTKETPKKSSYSFNTFNSDFSTPSYTDSSYKQVVKKPTETKSGSIKTKIKSKSQNLNVKTKVAIPKKKKM